jgi:DNA-binding MarR family transcriptional regulator
MTDATGDIEDLVHQRIRLGILTIALEVSSVQFGYLQRVMDLTPGNLGRHLVVLEEAKLIKIAKTFEGRRPSTSISITAAGRKALRAEIAALKSIVDRVERAESERTTLLEAARVSPQQRKRLNLT